MSTKNNQSANNSKNKFEKKWLSESSSSDEALSDSEGLYSYDDIDLDDDIEQISTVNDLFFVTKNFAYFERAIEKIFNKSLEDIRKHDADKKQLIGLRNSVNNRTLMQEFAVQNSCEGVQFMLDIGANPIDSDDKDSIDYALQAGSLNIFNILYKPDLYGQYKETNPALYIKGKILNAIFNCDDEQLRKLLENKIENRYSEIFIIYAVLLGARNQIEILWNKFKSEIDEKSLFDGFNFYERIIHISLERGKVFFEITAFLIRMIMVENEKFDCRQFVNVISFLQEKGKTKLLRSFLDSPCCKEFRDAVEKSDQANTFEAKSLWSPCQITQGEYLHALVELDDVEEFETVVKSFKFSPENLKAELAVKNNGLTVAQHAVKRGNQEIIKKLKLVEYDFADFTEEGENLLDFAIRCNSRITHYIYTNTCYLMTDEQSTKSRLLKAVSANDLNTIKTLLKSTELDAETKFLVAKFTIHYDDPILIDVFWHCIVNKFQNNKPNENVTLIFDAVTLTLKNKSFKAFGHLFFLLMRDARDLNLPSEFKMVEAIMTCQSLCSLDLDIFLKSSERFKLRNNLIQLGYVNLASYFFPLGAKVVPAIREKLVESDKSFRFYAQICSRFTDEHAVDYDDVVKQINSQPKRDLILKTPTLSTTLLHYFASLGVIKPVEALMNKAPELLPLKTVDKETAFDIAYSNQNFDVALFLLEKGAEFKNQVDKTLLIAMVFSAKIPELELQLVDVFKVRNWLWQVVSHLSVIPLLSQRAEFWKKLDWVKILEERFCLSEEDFVSSHKSILELLKTVLDETNTDKNSPLYKLACCDKFANYDGLIKACKKTMQVVSVAMPKSKKHKSKTKKSATKPHFLKLFDQYADSDAETYEANWQKIVEAFKSTQQAELEKIDTAYWIKLLQARVKHNSATAIKDFMQIFEPQGICGKVLLAIVADEKLFNDFKQYLPEFIKFANGTTLGTNDAKQWKIVHHLVMRSDEELCVTLIENICNKVSRLRGSKTPDGKTALDLARAQNRTKIVELFEPKKIKDKSKSKLAGYAVELPWVQPSPINIELTTLRQQLISSAIAKLIASQLAYASDQNQESFYEVIQSLIALKHYRPDLKRAINFSVYAYNDGIKYIEDILEDRAVPLTHNEETFLLLAHAMIACANYAIENDLASVNDTLAAAVKHLTELGGDFAKQIGQCSKDNAAKNVYR